MKGIILAGGLGTRLYPLTMAVSKQLMPVYDKPMIYYPLSTLLMAGIKDILVISTPQDLPNFEKLLGDGSEIGCNIQYKAQPDPNGLAQAFVLGEEFIAGDSAALVLGDNIFYGNGLSTLLQNSANPDGGIVFAYQVSDPERYGVAKNLKPSARGEYEITDVNKYYLEEGKLQVGVLSRGVAWLDTGTHKSLIQAGQFIEVIEERQGLKIGCIEEIAYKMGFIDEAQLEVLGNKYIKSGYGQYLLNLLHQNDKTMV